MNAIMTMSYVCEENHAAVIKLSDGLAGYIIKDLSKATSDPESHQHDGWHAYELAVGITNLTMNKENIKTFVTHGAIKPLIKMLEFNDDNEVECALNALWSLVTSETIGSMTYGEIITQLKKLKTRPNENVKAGAVRLETKLQELLGEVSSVEIIALNLLYTCMIMCFSKTGFQTTATFGKMRIHRTMQKVLQNTQYSRYEFFDNSPELSLTRHTFPVSV